MIKQSISRHRYFDNKGMLVFVNKINLLLGICYKLFLFGSNFFNCKIFPILFAQYSAHFAKPSFTELTVINIFIFELSES